MRLEGVAALEGPSDLSRLYAEPGTALGVPPCPPQPRQADRRETRDSVGRGRAGKSQPQGNATALPENSSGTRQLLDEVLDLITLVDDHVALVLLDYVLDFTGLVTRHDRKTVPLATNAVVLREGHQHASLAPACLPAFTLEFELLLGSGPLGALVESGALIVSPSASGLRSEPAARTAPPRFGILCGGAGTLARKATVIALPHHAQQGRGRSRVAAAAGRHGTKSRWAELGLDDAPGSGVSMASMERIRTEQPVETTVHNLVQTLSIKLDSAARYGLYVEDPRRDGYDDRAEVFERVSGREHEMIQDLILPAGSAGRRAGIEPAPARSAGTSTSSAEAHVHVQRAAKGSPLPVSIALTPTSSSSRSRESSCAKPVDPRERDDPVSDRIVVGVDGSAGSTAALRWGLAEARLRSGPLNVVHAYQLPPLAMADVAVAGPAGVGMTAVASEDVGRLRAASEAAGQRIIEQTLEQANRDLTGVELERTVIEVRPRRS
jgi:hypothetical protein